MIITARVVPECSAKLCLIAQGEMVDILNKKNHIFALFYQSILVIPMKLGILVIPMIPRGKGHVVWEFDLK